MKKFKKKGKVNQKDTGDSFEGMGNQMGWALKQRKKNTKFSRAQVKFLLEIYNEGEISGKKKDPPSVVQMMKCSTKESGDKFFRPNEYLRKEQIAAFFSRLTYQRWKGNTSVEDIVNTSDDDEVESTEENTTECGDESD